MKYIVATYLYMLEHEGLIDIHNRMFFDAINKGTAQLDLPSPFVPSKILFESNSIVDVIRFIIKRTDINLKSIRIYQDYDKIVYQKNLLCLDDACKLAFPHMPEFEELREEDIPELQAISDERNYYQDIFELRNKVRI